MSNSSRRGGSGRDLAFPRRTATKLCLNSVARRRVIACPASGEGLSFAEPCLRTNISRPFSFLLLVARARLTSQHDSVERISVMSVYTILYFGALSIPPVYSGGPRYREICQASTIDNRERRSQTRTRRPSLFSVII